MRQDTRNVGRLPELILMGRKLQFHGSGVSAIEVSRLAVLCRMNVDPDEDQTGRRRALQ